MTSTETTATEGMPEQLPQPASIEGILETLHRDLIREHLQELLHSGTPEVADARFQIFMEELEAHANPAFGEGAMPGITEAAAQLLDLITRTFEIRWEPHVESGIGVPSGEPQGL